MLKLNEFREKIGTWYSQLSNKEKASLGVFVGSFLLLLTTSCAEPLPMSGVAAAADLGNNDKRNQPTAQVDNSDVVVADNLDEATANLQQVATPTPTQTPRSTQEQPQPTETQVPYAVVKKNSNLRSDHTITSAIVAGLTSGENVVVIGKIDYPTGTFDWYEIQRTIGKRERGFIRGDLLGVSPTMTVPVLETLSAPTPAPKPPTIRESQTTKEVSVTYITPAVNTITFSNPYTQEGRAPGLVITNPQRFKVLTDNHPWYEIVFGGNRVWILATQDTVIVKGTEKVVVQASGPVVTNPETAPTSTGTHFSGIHTGGVWYIPEVELNLSDGEHNKRVVWSPETATITPVTGWVAEASEVTVYQKEGNLIFNVGSVDQNADGSYSVLGNRLNSSYVVYIYIKDDAGNDTATNTNLQYSPTMVSVDERVGVLGNCILLFVSRDKLPKIK